MIWKHLIALLATTAITASGARAPAQTRITRDPADDIFYQIMPIAWRDSNNDTGGAGQPTRFGDFDGLTASLPYLQSLGVTAVWLNPIHPSPAYHGYQHGPIDQVNSRFGTQAQFLNFVNQAHASGGGGIKVFIDVVCYGINTSTTYAPYFPSAFNNPASQYDTWLAFTNAGNTQYTGYSFTTWNGASVGFCNWDLRTAACRTQVINWCKKWIDPDGNGDPVDGIDGYRLDHVWVQYGTGPDGWGYNLDDFWTPWKAALTSVRSDVFTFVEQHDWGTTGAEFLPPHDAAFTKPFEFAARDALVNENAASLYSAMATAVAAVPTGKTFMGTIADHDVDRLSSAIQPTASAAMNREKVAAAVLLTQPFPPVIYYGDEIGMRGAKASTGSDADDIPFREPFKWNAVAGAPMSNYFVLNSSRYTNRVSRDNDGRSVPEQSGVAGSLLETYRTLIAARKNNIALRRGAYNPVTSTDGRVWAFVRSHASQTVLVAINLSGASFNTSLNMSAFAVAGGTTTPTDVLTVAALTPITPANRAAYSLPMSPYSWRILAVGITPPPPPPPSPADIDGRNIPADAGAASLRATQTVGTSFGDNANELNQIFVKAQPGALRVGITGNLATDGTSLSLLIDTDAAAGQNVLNTAGLGPPPGGLVDLSGLTLDTGFTPEHLFFVNAGGGAIFCDQVALPASGAPTKTYRGRGQTNDGDGTLTGATNPNNLYLAIDTTNTAGVTATSAANAATATKGFEFLIPFADIGLSGPPTARSCRVIRLAAFISDTTGTVSNQWLPGITPPQTASLGATPNMTSFAGVQFATITLPSAADFNFSGDVSVQDIFDFLAAYFEGLSTADFNGTGLTVQDIFDFLAAYFGSC